MRPGPLGSLQRGVLNVRANRELILLIWVQRGLVMLLSLASLLPFYLVLDIDLPGQYLTSEESVEWLTRSFERLVEQTASPQFWLAVVASSALLMIVLFVTSFFQAGAFGVLANGEMRTVPGSTVVTGFRSFSWASFKELAGARLWKYFWLLNLILGLWLIWVLFALLAVLVSGVAAAGAGIGIGVALGCFSLLPLAFGVVLLTFWGWLAQAEIGLRDCGVWAALWSSLGIALRRFGVMIALFVVLAIFGGGLAFVFLALTVTLEVGLAALATAQEVLWWTVQALQWLVTAVLQLTFAATLVAVARGETIEPAAEEE